MLFKWKMPSQSEVLKEIKYFLSWKLMFQHCEKKKKAPFVGLETIKFGLNLPMLLVFPKLHFLARFAWLCLMCMQIVSRGFKDKCEHLRNRRTCTATSKCNSLPILACTPSLLPLSFTASLLLLLLFCWSALTCSPLSFPTSTSRGW